MNENNFTLPAFHFRVLFKGLEAISEIDSQFQSVTGIKAIRDNNPAAGLERTAGATIFNPVVLKRGMVSPKHSVLLQWVIKSLHEPARHFLPEVLIEILNEENKPEIIIRLVKVSVRSWSAGDLHAEKSELLMEELVLDYTSIQLIAG